MGNLPNPEPMGPIPKPLASLPNFFEEGGPLGKLKGVNPL